MLRCRTDAPWGLQRITQRNRLPEGSLPGALNYVFPHVSSVNPVPVDVYVLSTGVFVEHPDFGGRASWGATFPKGMPREDAHGHGTHIAATIAGSRWGVAKQSNIIAVKVFPNDGRGRSSDIIMGVQWSIDNARSTGRASVINFGATSLGNPAVDGAFTAAVNAKVHVCVAAGNHNLDAGVRSPARVPGIITVGATTIEDRRRYDSNFGQVLDIFAPGDEITSAGISPANPAVTRSRTSVAAALATGAIAHLICVEGNRDPAAMLARLQELGVRNVLSDIPRGTP